MRLTASSISCRRGPRRSARSARGDAFESYALKRQRQSPGHGKAVGEKIAAGMVRVITERGRAADIPARRGAGCAGLTSPDWEPVMKIAAAIVTDRGGRTCHAAIVARELGVPAVVGCEKATAAFEERRARDRFVRRKAMWARSIDGAVPFEMTSCGQRSSRGRAPISC